MRQDVKRTFWDKRTFWENTRAVAESLYSSLEAGSAQAAVLQSLVAAYDRQTRIHVQRTARWARAVACHLQFSDEEIERLHLAALLHDIGKIGIPESILHKRGTLDEEEQGILRLHPEIGYHILLQAGEAFSDLASIVMAHHERWDGQGYPLGLAGEEIPLAARILAVTDAFDAMTSRRPYQRPLSLAEAQQELQRCAGSRYDALIVTAFLAMLDERSARRSPLAHPLFAATPAC
jgi:HD-GYP domain-containing protein (c-di-GMP phosphodiesterase class II)